MTPIKENWLNGPISKFFYYNQAHGVVTIYTHIHMGPGTNLNHELTKRSALLTSLHGSTQSHCANVRKVP
jgi:hypothetical protein